MYIRKDFHIIYGFDCPNLSKLKQQHKPCNSGVRLFAAAIEKTTDENRNVF